MAENKFKVIEVDVNNSNHVENLADHVIPSGSPLSSTETLKVSHVYFHRLILGVLQLIFEQISLPKASA